MAILFLSSLTNENPLELRLYHWDLTDGCFDSRLNISLTLTPEAVCWCWPSTRPSCPQPPSPRPGNPQWVRGVFQSHCRILKWLNLKYYRLLKECFKFRILPFLRRAEFFLERICPFVSLSTHNPLHTMLFNKAVTHTQQLAPYVFWECLEGVWSGLSSSQSPGSFPTSWELNGTS